MFDHKQFNNQQQSGCVTEESLLFITLKKQTKPTKKQTNKQTEKNKRYNLGFMFVTKVQYKDIFSISIVAATNLRGILKVVMTPYNFTFFLHNVCL